MNFPGMVFAIAMLSPVVQLPSAEIPASCAVTRPVIHSFLPPQGTASAPPIQGSFWYGTSALWTAVPNDGLWRGISEERSNGAHKGYWNKVLWGGSGYIGSIEERPQIAIALRRLDEASLPVTTLVIEIGTFTNTKLGDWDGISGFGIPTTGCWEVTGRRNGASVSYVVWVKNWDRL